MKLIPYIIVAGFLFTVFSCSETDKIEKALIGQSNFSDNQLSLDILANGKLG